MITKARMAFTSALAGILLISHGSEAPAKSTVKLGPNPVLAGGEYSSGGGITVALELRSLSGRAAVCGVWAESRDLTAYLNGRTKRVLANGSVFIDGERVQSNLLFLKETVPSESYTGETVTCAALGRAWRAADETAEVTVRIPRGPVVLERGGRKTGGPSIRFRQTDTHNAALLKGSFLPDKFKRFKGDPAAHAQDTPNQ